ncbi:TcfC E-set like domain-containing protein [Aeromonas hydrophila]
MIGVIVRVFVNSLLLLAVSAGLSDCVMADEGWIPAEFKALMQAHVAPLRVYYGQALLGTYEVSIRPGAVQISQPALLTAALSEVAPDKQLALTRALTGWQPSHTNLQCDADEMQTCAILQAEQVGVVLDEPRLRLRVFFPKRYLTTPTPQPKRHFLPDASQQSISSVHQLQLALAGDGQRQSYNLTGDSVIGRGAYHLEGQWHQAASAYASADFAVDQLLLKHDARGRVGMLGLLNHQQLSAWNSFRTLPHPAVWGLAWGSSSDTLLNKGDDSATPLPVYLPAAGRVELYRDARLLSTESVPVGNSLLNTDPLPNGVYELEVRGLVGARLVFSERRIFVKSSWLPSGDGGDFGVRLGWMSDNDASAQHALQGGMGWSKRVTSTQAVKAGAFLTPHWQQLEMGMMGVWPVNYNLSLVADTGQLGGELSVSGSVDTFAGYLEARYYHPIGAQEENPFINRPDQSLLAGVSYHFMPHHMLAYRYYYQYAQPLATDVYTTPASTSISHDISYTMTYPLGHSVQMNTSVGENIANSGDNIAYLNVSFFYINDYQLILNQRVQQDQHSTTLSAHWDDANPAWLDRASYSTDIAYSDENSAVGASMDFESSHLFGNAGVRHDINRRSQQGETSYYSNLRTALASDEQANIGWGKGEYDGRTGVLVDLTQAADLGSMELLIDNSSYPVHTGKMNWIPLQPYHTYTIRLRDEHDGNRFFNITGHTTSQTLYPGNVVRVAYQVEEDEILFGILTNKQGLPISNAVISGRFQSRSDNSGQFQVRVPRNVAQLSVREENGSDCIIHISDYSDDSPFHSVGIVTCTQIGLASAHAIASNSTSKHLPRINRS